jgi:hypothetical protein
LGAWGFAPEEEVEEFKADGVALHVESRVLSVYHPLL